MNGNWFPWSEGVNGNQPGEFVAAWRHVHDIFDRGRAPTNVTWVWCPNVDPDSTCSDLASLYPGDDYVDWTGLDGYNWGTNPAKPDRWRSFDRALQPTYNEIADTIAPSKPMMIGEIGSTEYGGSKASWIKEALAADPDRLPEDPRPALVRQVRRRHGLADRDLGLGQDAFAELDRPNYYTVEQLRQPAGADESRTASIAAGSDDRGPSQRRLPHRHFRHPHVGPCSIASAHAVGAGAGDGGVGRAGATGLRRDAGARRGRGAGAGSPAGAGARRPDPLRGLARRRLWRRTGADRRLRHRCRPARASIHASARFRARFPGGARRLPPLP